MLQIHGHELAVQLLEHGLRTGQLHHAYLIAGPAHIGKTTLAIQLAQALNCGDADSRCRDRIAEGTHADVRFIGLTGKANSDSSGTLIGIDAVRELQGFAHLTPFESPWHVFIIDHAERLSTEAANALLKLLEEPPPRVLLLLLADDAAEVLPTVRSRCQILELRPLPVPTVARVLEEEHGASAAQARQLAKLSRGCLGWAIEALQGTEALGVLHHRLERLADLSQGGVAARFAYADDVARRYQANRSEGREELYQWLQWWRDVMLIQQDRGQSIVHEAWRTTLEETSSRLHPRETLAWLTRIYDAIDALERNANPRLVLEALLLDFPAPSH